MSRSRVLIAVLALVGISGCTEANRPTWLNNANAEFERNVSQYPGGGAGYGVDAALSGAAAAEQVRATRRLYR